MQGEFEFDHFSTKRETNISNNKSNNILSNRFNFVV